MGTLKHKKYRNWDYFKVLDTREKCYWFGFLYGDGCVTKGTMYIQLQLSDADMLLKFASIFSSNPVIGVSKTRDMVYYENRVIHDDLIRLGLLPRKSLIRATGVSNNISEEFINSFALGLLDADGHVGGDTVNWSNGCYEILEMIKNASPVELSFVVPKDSNIAILSCTGYNKLAILYRWLYKGATTWMVRKRLAFEKLSSKECRGNGLTDEQVHHLVRHIYS